MNPSYILHADLLDIIFENRNKAYGAYTLRKLYEQHVVKSLGVVITLLGIFSFLVLTSKNPVLVSVTEIPEQRSTSVIPEIPVTEPKPDLAPAKRDKSMSNNIILVDSIQKADSLVAADDRVVMKSGNDTDFEPIFSGSGGVGDDALSPAPPSSLPMAIVPIVDISKPMDKADIDPSYPGGLKALTRFLEKNLENPAEVNEGETVAVKVKFVVGFDGILKSFEVKEDGGELFNKEVIRVLKKMPRWIPGKTNGQNVSVYFTIPVKFINGQ